MTEPTQPLLDLAAAHGVSTAFTDWRGRTVSVPAESIEAVLTALGVETTDPTTALQATWLAPWRRMLPPYLVVTGGVERWCWVHVPHGADAALAVELESGGTRPLAQVDHWVDPREVDGALVGEATFAVPGDLPLGYHRLVARSGDRMAEAPLIVAPARLALPERMGARPAWGFAAQLYSVRSRGSWGVGDLADLTDLAVWSADRLGADYLLVNPMHAAEPVAPLEPSPYLPSSRRYAHPLYLRVERIPEFADLDAAARAEVDALLAGVHRELDDLDAIDRDTAWTAKRQALRLVFAVPRSAGRELDLAAYRRREGAALTDFVTWSVLAEQHGNDARAWPEELRDAHSPAVAAAAAARAEEVDLAVWLQWVLDEQLATAQSKARGAGMAIGVMQDLAVGVHPGGADAWRLADTYASGITVGAPPDPFNRLGQNWLQPPWRPDRLAELGFAPLRDLIASVLRHAGGVRVDHVIGLFRLWWVPEGRPPSEGAYVRYDPEATIGVLALEAHRAGAVLVGEDLGVVEPGARTLLAERGVLGTSVLWFERDADGGAVPAERWREACLASVTTHDLPPTAGYLDGEHVRLQHRLGLLDGPLDEALADDRAERGRWLAELRRRRLLHEDDDTDAVVVALHRYLALTPARLRNVALTDAVGDRRTQNQPGTLDEYPNWRVPLSGADGRRVWLEDVFRSDRVRRVVDAVRGVEG